MSKTESCDAQIVEQYDRVPSRDYRASAADRDRSLKTNPFIYLPYKFVPVRQSPRRAA